MDNGFIDERNKCFCREGNSFINAQEKYWQLKRNDTNCFLMLNVISSIVFEIIDFNGLVKIYKI